MSQKSNMELVENLRPFIHKMIADYLAAVGGSLTAGDNISIVDGVISLADIVTIGQSITVPADADLLLGDEDFSLSRKIYIDEINGKPHLLMQAGGEIEVLDLANVPPGAVDLFRF